jgi:hypothetical protein
VVSEEEVIPALVQRGDLVAPAAVAVMPTKALVQGRQVKVMLAHPVH